MGIFVCVALISVKSKYGSCSGSCTGLIKSNNNKKKLYNIWCGVTLACVVEGYFLPPSSLFVSLILYYIKEGSFIGKKGWAVNSIAIAFKSSNLLSPRISNLNR